MIALVVSKIMHLMIGDWAAAVPVAMYQTKNSLPPTFITSIILGKLEIELFMRSYDAARIIIIITIIKG